MTVRSVQEMVKRELPWGGGRLVFSKEVVAEYDSRNTSRLRNSHLTCRPKPARSSKGLFPEYTVRSGPQDLRTFAIPHSDLSHCLPITLHGSLVVSYSALRLQMNLDDSGHDCGTRAVRIRHTDASSRTRRAWTPTLTEQRQRDPRRSTVFMHVSRKRVLMLALLEADARGSASTVIPMPDRHSPCQMIGLVPAYNGKSLTS